MNIASVNLNLFVTFEALLAERNVTRAARRIGVTQSAVSSSLRQLRAIFDDPLFLRGPRGVTPTPRALDLAPIVERGLATLGAALAPTTFDARSAERRFAIAASDYVAFVLLPPLVARLAREAPRIHVDVLPWGRHEVTDMLARGEADLMLGYAGRLPAQHRERALFTEEYACIVRRGHPRIGARLGLRAWVDTPHVVVSEKPGAAGAVDRVLAERGLTRTIALRVPHFLMVPHVVAKTDWVAALSRRVAVPFARGLRLRVLPPPLPLPAATTKMIWHERMDADAGHAWLRGVLAAVAAGV